MNHGGCPQDVQRHKPAIRQALRSIGLDVAYHRARADFLYYSAEDGSEVEVLDLVGGYGTLLLGHNHPALVAEATRFLSSGNPNHVQGSQRRPAERLASELVRRAQRDDVVIFANSGTEAVEAAIKHAMLETGGRTFLALEGGFHGKTLGAIQLTANPLFRDPFELQGLNVVRIRLNDVACLENTVAQTPDLAGLIFEPVLGEGGVRPVSRTFANRMAELCRSRNVPLIADECQTGLGRTGTFLASESLQVDPDYVVLSKALGGGLAKISALLVDRRRYRSEFDLLHSSTFADDDLSCAIALQTLFLVDSKLLEDCRQRGEWLQQQLVQVQKSHPSIIADVRGAGLMIGIELRDQSRSVSFLLRQMSARGLLGPIVAGRMLRTHQIRIAPTLSDPLTIRVQPSAFISRTELERFVTAFEETCERLEHTDVLELTSHLPVADPCESSNYAVGSQTKVFQFQPVAAIPRNEAAAKRKCFGWLFHLTDADDAPSLEPALMNCSLAARDEFLARLAPYAEPVVMPSMEITSATGDSVDLLPILLPVTSAWLKQQVELRRIKKLTQLLNRAVEVAGMLGADLVSLGQFTSIVSDNGRNLDVGQIGLATGNSYTAALIVERVRQAQLERGVLPETSTLAIVGAAGNIGRVCAEILAPDYYRTILVGRRGTAALHKMHCLARQLPTAVASCELQDIAAADVVVCVTNCIEPLLGPNHFRRGAIVCDASVPPMVRAETSKCRPDVTVFRGGIVRLPNRERLSIPGFPLPHGYVFGCMAEGAILCLEGVQDTTYTGRLCPEKVARIEHLAMRHGFGPADFSALDVMSSQGVVTCPS